MSQQSTRREILKGSLAVAGLGVLGIPEWAIPALAQGETLVPFTDMPANVQSDYAARPADSSTSARSTVRSRRRISSSRPSTTAIPRSTRRPFSCKVSGLVDRPKSFSLDDLRKMGARSSWPASSARATAVRCRVSWATDAGPGVPLKAVLDPAGVKPQAREFVFFGADHGEEEVEWRGRRSSRSNSSSAAACRARRRCRPSRSWPTR